LWARKIGSTDLDRAYVIEETLDGGFVFAGSILRPGAGYPDALVVKLDPSGNLLWAKAIGGTSYDGASDLALISDGGLLIVGSTESFGSGASDVLIIKLNSIGNVQWAKVSGTAGNDYGRNIAITNDNGFLMTGRVGSEPTELLVSKFDKLGVDQWHRTLKHSGNTGNSSGYAIAEANDNSIFVLGFLAPFPVALVKFAPTGAFQWAKGIISKIGWTYEYELQVTSDNSLIFTAPYAEDFYPKAVFVKTTLAGEVLFARQIGDDLWSDLHSVHETLDGGYIIGGGTEGMGSNGDGMLILADKNGNIANCGKYVSSLSLHSELFYPTVSGSSPIVTRDIEIEVMSLSLNVASFIPHVSDICLEKEIDGVKVMPWLPLLLDE
jgi:hypothetical protein